MTSKNPFQLEGNCDCKHIRYRLEAKPLIIHCCHCRWCQRETGSSFALNAVIEASNVTILNTDPEIINTPSQSGRGQQIARCPKCRIAVWSNYPNAGPLVRFIRVGTLENPDAFSPDIHIYASSKQRWVVLDGKVPIVPEFYEIEKVWSRESLERWDALKPMIEEYRAKLAAGK
ncbi:glutathione-dependent formaldehyde-activating GFA [Hyaloscypha hepaticicola]|uniref:Glutathione-dependent formaldehyde-activating GFA n=1 Tax=Hyaloscypha hepaticicola TaxID=2082293 RepID=A0A2J6PN15_9HELO|nr:glutathione-dependent formaldehyde-activating GFA [Hyaloscypha hepaticicola]